MALESDQDSFNADTPGLGPQYGERDPAFTYSMRRHQSWYRAHVLGVPWGTTPRLNSDILGSSVTELGNMLNRESGAEGLNFLTPQIFEVAKKRIASKKEIVDEYRLLHNMLSSQPMCFNLLGPLVEDLDLATRIFKKILPDEVAEVVRVLIEFAPEPASEYLDDKTAFDAFVEFRRTDDSMGFIGVETKWTETEAFHQKHYDSPAYRQWTELDDSPWPKDSWPHVDKTRYNQLWRDHLLAVAMKYGENSPYASGYLMPVYHPEDKICSKTTAAYLKLLKPENTMFFDYPLDKLVSIIEACAMDASSLKWLSRFRKRYLDLLPSADRRKHVRCLALNMMNYWFVEEDGSLPGHQMGRTLDISANGLQFESLLSLEQEFEISRELLLNIQIDEWMIKTRCKVIHLVHLLNNMLGVGVEFIDLSDEDKSCLGKYING